MSPHTAQRGWSRGNKQTRGTRPGRRPWGTDTGSTLTERLLCALDRTPALLTRRGLGALLVEKGIGLDKGHMFPWPLFVLGQQR